MKTELKTKLLAALMQTRADIKNVKLYHKCVDKYVDGVLIEIRDALAKNIKVDSCISGAFMFAQKTISTKMKRILVNGVQTSIYNIMQGHESTSLLTEIRKGTKIGISGRQSIVKLNALYEDLILIELSNLCIDADTDGDVKQLALQDNEFVLNIDVNPATLRDYVEMTKHTMATTDKGKHYKDTLLENLMAAQKLLTMVRAADESNATTYIREVWRQVDSGRIFGLGNSLQRQKKEVREAALGVCHKYDFKACAFALMAGLAHSIDPTLKIGAVLDYVKNREKIRERVAAEVGIERKLVKTLFTALGFGAGLANNYQCAIRSTLQKDAHIKLNGGKYLEDTELFVQLGDYEYKKLTANTTFCEIHSAFNKINSVIISYYKNNPMIVGCKPYNPLDKDGKEKSSKKMLAYIYHALEFQAMSTLVGLVEQGPLLTAHDCVYYKNKLSDDEYKTITWELQKQYKYLLFEYNPVYPITMKERYYSRYTEDREDERKHKELILEQEQAAMHYVSPNNWILQPLVKNLTDEEYELKHRVRFLSNIDEVSVENMRVRNALASYIADCEAANQL